MKRTALRRTTGLSRSSRLRPRSKKTVRAAIGRREFVREFLIGRPCELRDLSRCFGRMTVHERIKRSHGGAIVPGAKAEAQGQTFHALCVFHNEWVEDYPAESRRRGLA